MNLTLLENGDTLIRGEITDQSELLGILRQIGEMNLVIKKLEKNKE